MSIISSSRKSSLSARSGKNRSSRRSVRFQLDYNLKSVLTETERQKYKELICNIRDAGLEIRDDELLQILSEARECIGILENSHHLFVQVLLVVKWAHRSVDVVEAYQGFVLDLCSAHNYYTKFAIEQLVSNFKPVGEHSEWEEGRACEEEEVCYQRVHALLKQILLVIPMSVDLLVYSVSDNFPYVRCKNVAYVHVAYVSNVLKILNYRPELRQQFLSLVFNKLLELDVNAPRSELDESDCEDMQVFPLDDTATGMSHPIADALDLCLDLMFRYVHAQCHIDGTLCWERTKSFYSDVVTVFDRVVLPTHGSHHVQFLVFYLLSFKSNLLLWFLKYLWGKVTDPNVFHVFRQAAISYIASLLSRAKYVPMSAVKDMLTQLSTWVHGYISNCDQHTSCDPRLHSVFYSACQALFYLIAFHHREIVMNSPKGLAFLQGLNLAKVVTCRLNPLRVCLPAVTQNFASVARHYQLVYCYSIIEHNSRNTIPVVYPESSSVEQVILDTFFPFDPYLLRRTKKYIDEWYRVYNNSLPDDISQREGVGEEEDDDFLMDQSPANSSMFTYGTSPGFLQT